MLSSMACASIQFSRLVNLQLGGLKLPPNALIDVLGTFYTGEIIQFEKLKKILVLTSHTYDKLNSLWLYSLLKILTNKT